jgi:catechol 2,3-dioxygenase-like lactoylglutathione lyase family enzyme
MASSPISPALAESRGDELCRDRADVADDHHANLDREPPDREPPGSVGWPILEHAEEARTGLECGHRLCSHDEPLQNLSPIRRIAMNTTSGPVRPSGLNHLVINVRNLAETHTFWTQMLGFQQVGEFVPKDNFGPQRKMQFYSADHGGGQLSRHDVAFMEFPELPAPAADGTLLSAIGHIAIALPDRESWLRQLAYLQASGVTFERRVEHGPTHSLYIRDPNGYTVEMLYELPREIWEGNIEAALNHYVALPTEGEAALRDRAEGNPVFA